MWVFFDVVVVISEDSTKEFMFGVMDCFDDVAVVAGEVEEGTGFSWRTEFGEDVFCGKGEEVVCWVQSEMPLAQIAENEGRVVLELEVVLGRRRKLVSNSV